jgi:hypothetical protein
MVVVVHVSLSAYASLLFLRETYLANKPGHGGAAAALPK